MIYPFTVKSITTKLEGTFDVVIERQTVSNYTDPATQESTFMTPTVMKYQEFYHVPAETEEAAMDAIAQIIAVAPVDQGFKLDLSKAEVNVVSS